MHRPVNTVQLFFAYLLLPRLIVAKWYKAPELFIGSSGYTKSADVWSIGCIFAELLGRTPLFPGSDYLDQIQRIIDVLGTPTLQDVALIKDEKALKYLKSLPKQTKKRWENIYPKATPQALDLLDKMLTFNPKKRYTVEECLAHPYLQDLHDIEDEPFCEESFDWAADNIVLTKQLLQEAMYKEACNFHCN